MKKNHASTENAGITRRTFVATSAVAVAGTAFATSPVFAQLVPAEEILSVGYWPGSVKGKWMAQTLDNKTDLGVIDASAILTPDPTFLERGAVVSVLGLWRPARRTNVPMALDVEVLYRLEAGSEQEVFPFRAWSYGFRNGVASASTPVRVNLPVQSDSNLEFRTRRRIATPDARLRGARLDAEGGVASVARFGIMHGSPIRLQQGTYFFAIPEEEGVVRPRWEGLSTSRTGGREMTLRGYGILRSGSRSEPVDFSYLVLSVERGVLTLS
jgi:hypothetical protein